MKLTRRNSTVKSRRETIITSISMHPKEKDLLDWFDERARVDRISRSHLIIDAMKEYRRKHWEGNPQTLLLVEGKPPAAEARVEARTRQAVVFLRFKARLSYDQISEVVGKSHGWVYKFCKSLTHNGRYPLLNNRRGNFRKADKAFKKNSEKYRERFEAFMKGRIDSLEEAFSW